MSEWLRISTRMAGGNALVLEQRLVDGRPELHFTPTPAGGPEAMWFCFEMTACQTPAPATIGCVLHFVDTLLGGGDGSRGFYPVFKTERRDWARVEAVRCWRLPDDRPLVAWEVPGDEGTVQVALCYPYGLAEQQALIDALAPVFSVDAIGVTLEQRRLLRLANRYGEADSTRPGLYCLARQHAGETPGSWVLDGFLRQMAAAGAAAPLVWAVPFTNVDGVVAGHYGKDSFPYDFNRAWGAYGFPADRSADFGSHPMRYEVMCMQADMRRWTRRCRPLAVLDFHAPGLSEADGVYCYLRELGSDGLPLGANRAWVEAFQTALGEGVAAAKFARCGRYASRWNTARVGDFVTSVLNLGAFTFEVPYGRTAGAVLTRESYRQAGRQLAAAACQVAETSAAHL